MPKPRFGLTLPNRGVIIGATTVPEMIEMAEMAEEIVKELGLVGSNGVDFLLTEKGPVVVEVNPRFQGSLDAIELSTGINVFQAHVDAFEGMLPEGATPTKSAGRAILFADENIEISEPLARWIAVRDWVVDVPRPGSSLKRGDPVASVLATGKSRAGVMDLLIERAALLRGATKYKG
jgi:predicted ATP-grasp superfamily ATP-dependent carboligase